ncbi:PREDICTED: E3 ubiquitin-protein ligase SINA-like 7 isoform X1 [Populus euphratica]|uniref:RING-type E3 ubiquitin transferase n=2 Tax=Populus euphratica TaxID=75702 RepID=A0AAJ6UTS3_POPEU|nr:PREDICTED: E3 ubiquitin-protein ligase SINA-like 7 isoform X1 [Populus euphratica]
MRKFLLEDGEGSSYPRPKRQRPSSPSSPPPPEFPMEEIAREEEDSDEEEDDDEDTSDESEEEDEEEVEEIVRPLPRPPLQQNNQMETVGLQLLQPRLYESPIFLEPTLVRPSRNGAIFVALSDPEVLDCPTCCETLTIPVFQCQNGHVACSSCSKKLQHKCPSCAMPIGDNRCCAIEKVLESLKVQCSNWRYGCRENICFSKKYEHDKWCSHALCTCPLLGCNFQGSSKQLYLHCRRKHLGKLTSFQFNTSFPLFITVNDKFCILQEDKEGVLFILNNRWDTLGHVITVSCMGLSSSKPGYFYKLMTRAEGSNIRFQSSTRNVQTRVDDPPSLGCLLVPNDFLGAYGQITLDVCIWHLGSYPAISSVRA